jgi:hypothetical protein
MIFRECGVLYLDPPKQHLEEDPSRNFLIHHQMGRGDC